MRVAPDRNVITLAASSWRTPPSRPRAWPVRRRAVLVVPSVNLHFHDAPVRVLEAHDTAVRTNGAPILDLDFIAQHTHGFEAFAEDLRRTR